MNEDIVIFINKIHYYNSNLIDNLVSDYNYLFNKYNSFDFYQFNNERSNKFKKNINIFYLNMIDNKNFDISLRDYDNNTLLHYMCKIKNSLIANKLIDYYKNNNSDLYDIENNDMDYVIDIILKNNLSLVGCNLVELYQLKNNNYIQSECLVQSCYYNNSVIANKILNYYIDDINQSIIDKGTALLFACKNNMKSIAIKILNNNLCDYKDGSIYMTTPLMYACKNSMVSVVKLILNKIDCDLEYINQDDANGYSALSYACIKKNKNIIKMLINKGAYFTYYNQLNNPNDEYITNFIPVIIKELGLIKEVEKQLLNISVFDELDLFIDFINTFNNYEIYYEDDIDINNKSHILYYDNVLNNMIQKEERFKFCFTNKKNVLLFICKNALYFHLNKTAKRIIKMLTLHDIQIKDKNGYSIIDIIYNLNNEKLIDLVYETFNYKRDKCNKDCIICYNNDMGYFLDCTKCKNSYHSKCFWDFYNVSGNKKCLLCFSENTLFNI